MNSLLKKFEQYISYILMIVAMLFACYQLWDLVYHFVSRMVQNIENRTFSPENAAQPVTGIFFGILLTLEIIQTIRIFSQDHGVKLKIILIVGLIAVTRKILMLEMKETDTAVEFAIAALILALSIGYFLVSKAEMVNKEK